MRNASLPVPTGLLLFASMTYVGVLWEALAGFPLTPASSYLSELGARNQPMSAAFRLLDTASGILVVAAVSIGGRTLIARRAGRLSARLAPAHCAIVWLIGGGLGLFGAGTILDSAFPMACATSLSATCAAADAAGTLGLAHQLHTFTSAGALTGAAAVACGLIVWGVDRLRGDRGTVRAQPGTARMHGALGAVLAIVIALAVLLSSAVVTGYALVGMADGVLPEGGGYVQRAQTVSISLMLVAVAFVYLRQIRRTLGTALAQEASR